MEACVGTPGNIRLKVPVDPADPSEQPHVLIASAACE